MRKIAILNASSFVGRIVPNFMADFYGPMNSTYFTSDMSYVICSVHIVVGPTGVCCGLIIFLMFAAKSIGALVTFAVLYGFFSGTSELIIAPVFVITFFSLFGW